MTLICVKCGSNKANIGSMRHPYCEECFKKEYKNNYKKYLTWLLKTHG